VALIASAHQWHQVLKTRQQGVWVPRFFMLTLTTGCTNQSIVQGSSQKIVIAKDKLCALAVTNAVTNKHSKSLIY